MSEKDRNKTTLDSNYQDSLVHDSQRDRFSIELPDGESAFVHYHLDESKREVDFYSTFVPDSHRGLGLAGILVDAAFAWAEAYNGSGLIIKTSCSYADVKYQRRMKHHTAQA